MIYTYIYTQCIYIRKTLRIYMCSIVVGVLICVCITLWVCTYMYVYISHCGTHICIYTYIRTYMYIYIHMYIYICMYVHIYICAYIYIRTYYIAGHTGTYIPICPHTHIHEMVSAHVREDKKKTEKN